MNANAHERILVALDYDNADDAVRLTRTLVGRVGGFKVGIELVNAAGFDVFDRLKDAGADRLFYDAKFHDIPNTVAGAVRAAARRGVWMVNVHATGGAAMLRAAREAADEGAAVAGNPRPLVIGVTVLTSLDERTLNDELRVAGPVGEHVSHLARLCRTSGLDGVVASAREVSVVRAACGPDFVTVIPGIRPAGTDTHDQARVATPGAAVADGAHYLVLGRAVTAAPDPAEAADRVAKEIGAALAA
jgi:orotidine-5'-phosphate decarboxylase